MAHLEDLKSVLTETLERRGVLQSVRGRIRAEVFNALDDKAISKPKPTNDTILINELIREYLEYNNYKYAAMTLKSESGQAEIPLSREFIESELRVQATKQTRRIPLLYSLVHSFVQQGKEKEEIHANVPSTDMGKHFIEFDDTGHSSYDGEADSQ